MKVHVAKMNQEVVTGYQHVVASDNFINFMNISDNECEAILANDVLNCFTLDKVRDCIVSLVNKLRLQGTMVVGGTDIRLFSLSVINNLISEQEANEVINSVNCMPSYIEVTKLIESLGLKVESIQSSGIHFEIVARRG